MYLALSESKVKKSVLVFSPDSTGKAFWDVMGFFFVIYQSIVVPYRICFEVEAEGFFLFVETLIDICFIIDIGKFIFALTHVPS